MKNLQWRKTWASEDCDETDQGCSGDFVEVVGRCCGQIMLRDGGWVLMVGLGSSVVRSNHGEGWYCGL